MQYKISVNEINRRKNAYKTFSGSLIIGLIISSAIFNYPISIGGYVLVISIIASLGYVSFSFFRDMMKMKIYFSGRLLIRVVNNITEKYELEKVERLKVKWTTNHTIREIVIIFNNGKTVYISALENIDLFKKDLIQKIGKNVQVKDIHEILDFDHPLFYSLLGFPITIVGVMVVKSISSLNVNLIKYGGILLCLYLLILGVYFFTHKPFAKSYGNNNKSADFISGSILVIFSAATFIFLLHL